MRAFGATVFDFMGATLTMLHKRPPAADDADNPARLGWGVPLPEFAPEFEVRFGVRLVEVYGSTDAGVPIYQPLDEPRRPGSCGRAIPPYDVRVFDEQDIEVPPGTVGELVVRPLEPSLMADGYYGMPEATIASRRNLLVPHRRPRAARRGRLVLLRRPAHGLDPPAGREHLRLRGRGGGEAASRTCSTPRRTAFRASSARTT